MRKDKNVYPIILTKTKSGYSVYMPDFEKNTQGKGIADAIDMAKDALEMMGVFWQDEGRKIPAPSPINEVKAKESDIVTLVAVDFDEYRRKTETKAVKKTLTLPSWLNVKAEDAGINFSAVLQEALKEKLGVSA
ncbi:MAG: type II toxin-antitoxin system HicB family antitoxin [Clostridiales Family XIII bacterium]|nr:type II toxin-antitoxin system HicB family antitoxin [Clostridiales Family XIII bacterium]